MTTPKKGVLDLLLFSMVFFLPSLSGGNLFGQDSGDRIQLVPEAITEGSQSERFHWGSALVEASIFLGIEHSFRLAQDPMVRHGLRGPFFRDYADSVDNISGWGDGDPALVNYVGHPISGAVAGFIEVQNDPRFSKTEVGWTNDYFKSRMRAMAFAAGYSLQFEIGPISEASIGGIQRDESKRGIVDWVITPTLGTAWLVTEDITDKFLVGKIERHTRNRVVIGLARCILNPARSFSNLLGRRRPWQREDRPGLNVLGGRSL